MREGKKREERLKMAREKESRDKKNTRESWLGATVAGHDGHLPIYPKRVHFPSTLAAFEGTTSL